MAGAYLDSLEARISALESLPTNSKELAVVAATQATETLEQKAAEAKLALEKAQADLAAAEAKNAEIAAAIANPVKPVAVDPKVPVIGSEVHVLAADGSPEPGGPYVVRAVKEDTVTYQDATGAELTVPISRVAVVPPVEAQKAA
jgi:hypothetical protein